MRYEWPLRRIFGGFGIALVALAPAVIVAKAVDDGMLSVAQILAVQGIAAQNIDDLGVCVRNGACALHAPLDTA